MTPREMRDEFLERMEDSTLTERLFSALPDIVFCLKNRDRVYMSANDAFAERVGLGSRWTVVGKRAEDLFPKVLADHYRSQDEEVLATGRGFQERLELVPLRGGGLGWFLASKVPIHDREGALLGIASVSQDLRLPSGQEMNYRELAEVVTEIEQRFAEDLSRKELACRAGLSEEQFERRLKRVFGLSLNGFVRKLRVEYGSRLLVETDKSLAEISLDCGYSEQSAFSRQFKSTVGMPPGKYRAEFGGWWRGIEP
ncbi:AraC family transcriptional regulator [Roseibacillus persicicus]|nr:AraC family transcriptional regulator [Roseibacillus persicicus]